MPVIYLGLGSNLGDRERNIREAVALLEKAGIDVQKISALIETEPAGGPRQGKFLNAVLKAECALAPLDLLKAIHAIENKLGRVRGIKNGPRTIDVDILLYDRLKTETPELTIPHPRMLERPFVMQPLGEIEPDLPKIIPQ